MQGWTVDLKTLPARFPTHRHDAVFWERLGRTIATFGFLEEVLGKAIFSFTATRPYKAAEIDSAFENWLPRLTRALTDPPGKLVSEFGKAVREHPQGELGDLDELLAELREALRIRNVLCHGSWRLPDNDGRSTPLFVDQGGNLFDTAIDCAFLDQVQRHVAELACAVVSSVTRLGWQFPGSSGQGIPIVKS